MKGVQKFQTAHTTALYIPVMVAWRLGMVW